MTRTFCLLTIVPMVLLAASSMVSAEQVPPIPAVAPAVQTPATQPPEARPRIIDQVETPPAAPISVAAQQAQAIDINPSLTRKSKKGKTKKAQKKTEVEPEFEEEPVTRDELVEGLRSQIKALEDRHIVAAQIAEAIQRPVNASSVESKTIYTYLPDAVYMVYGAVNHIVDIQLQPGEKLTSPPAAGDTVRWIVGTASSGSGPETVTHVLLKPVRPDIETNFLITTDRHAYRLYARASKNFFVPTIAWVYPQEEATKAALLRRDEQVKEEQMISPPVPPEKLNFEYQVKAEDDYPWTPLRVFDDGQKTYIQMPPDMSASEAPAFFIRDGKELNLVNYRLKGEYFVIDRLLEEGELRSGTRDIVKIQRRKSWNWSLLNPAAKGN